MTYGPFRPHARAGEYHDPAAVERDFEAMAASGINAVRTYTVPPPWLLDLAQRNGLWVVPGLPWEQHIAFLDDRARVGDIEAGVRRGVAACAGHPAVLAYSIGNEIPASIVRWHGARRVERFLERLYRAAKSVDPHALVTYANFPSTEYLALPFLDFVSFNLYLESQPEFAGYLARLHSLAAERPLLLTEVGLDSNRNGIERQAETLEWQVRTAFAAGCAGTFAFAWTDEWHRGGHDIEDWDFGLTDRQRRPKPALEAVARAFGDVPFPSDGEWPRISVVVCSYNGARTIRDCLDGVTTLDYPDYEVIVVNDGSTDVTPAIAGEFDVRLISTDNHGLSRARNTGMRAATGDIIAYTDDDARPDPQWLRYLAHTFITSDFAAVGGPNLAPIGDGPIAECVANAPGGPIHVLLSDVEAEHIPGCNFAVRKECLEAIGGFDPQFRVAGDDVDVCWRLQARGWRLGFSPAALVWHHRRNSVRAYWRQQRGYGKAEALLERKWPEKYSAAGHLMWSGRLYGKGLMHPLGRAKEHVFHGIWGTALFQTVYRRQESTLSLLPLMPEWYGVLAILIALSALGLSWGPLLYLLPLLALASGVTLAQALGGARRAQFTAAGVPARPLLRFRLGALTALLYLLQPAARLYGRLCHGLSPLRPRGEWGMAFPRPRLMALWYERWEPLEDRLRCIQRELATNRAAVRSGGGFDRWDLEVQVGLLGSARLRTAMEEHGAGRQLVRARTWPRCSPWGLALAIASALAAVPAGSAGAWAAAASLGAAGVLVALRMLGECAAAELSIRRALRRTEDAKRGATIEVAVGVGGREEVAA